MTGMIQRSPLCFYINFGALYPPPEETGFTARVIRMPASRPWPLPLVSMISVFVNYFVFFFRRLVSLVLVMMLAAHPATRIKPMPTKDNTGSESWKMTTLKISAIGITAN